MRIDEIEDGDISVETEGFINASLDNAVPNEVYITFSLLKRPKYSASLLDSGEASRVSFSTTKISRAVFNQGKPELCLYCFDDSFYA